MSAQVYVGPWSKLDNFFLIVRIIFKLLVIVYHMSIIMLFLLKQVLSLLFWFYVNFVHHTTRPVLYFGRDECFII